MIIYNNKIIGCFAFPAPRADAPATEPVTMMTGPGCALRSRAYHHPAMVRLARWGPGAPMIAAHRCN